jgi:hypothetical protein
MVGKPRCLATKLRRRQAPWERHSDKAGDLGPTHRIFMPLLRSLGSFAANITIEMALLAELASLRCYLSLRKLDVWGYTAGD